MMKILFQKGSYSITEEDISFLDAIARNLRLYQNFRIAVVGDLIDENVMDRRDFLSEKRTDMVVDVLRGFGVPTSRINCEVWKNDPLEIDSVKLFVFKS